MRASSQNATKSNNFNGLAILAGPPAFSEPLHVNRPHTAPKACFEEYFNEAWQAQWFTNNGPLVQKLEREIARYLEVENCILTCNGTIALALLIHTVGLRGEVILPSFTFISTAHTLRWAGIGLAFADINSKDYTIDVESCRRLIGSETTAIIATHTFGEPCEIGALEALAAERGLHLFFDAAHAFGSSYGGRRIGSFGDAEVFSFHSTKVFHTFEGGAITTNNSVLAERLRRARNFGFDGYDAVSMVGTNAKMPEVNAAMGLANFEHRAAFFEKNFGAYKQYQALLAKIPGVQFHEYSSAHQNNHQYVCIEIDKNEFGLTRDELINVLHAENVLARRYFFPGCHAMQPYRDESVRLDANLPVTVDRASRIVVLPGGASVTEAEIERIANILLSAHTFASEIRASMTKGGNCAEA